LIERIELLEQVIGGHDSSSDVPFPLDLGKHRVDHTFPALLGNDTPVECEHVRLEVRREVAVLEPAFKRLLAPEGVLDGCIGRDVVVIEEAAVIGAALLVPEFAVDGRG